MKKRWKCCIIIGLIILILAAAAYGFLRSGAAAKSRVLLSLSQLIREEDAALKVDLEFEIDGQVYDLQAETFRTEAGGQTLTSLTSSGMTLYISEGAIYLEDGTVYRLASSQDDAKTGILTWLKVLKTYYTGTSVSVSQDGESRIYQLSLDDEAGIKLIESLYPSAAESITELKNCTLLLNITNGKAAAVDITCEALADGHALSLYAEIEILEVAEDPDVPDDVIEAIEAGDDEDAVVLTEELLRLAAAWQALSAEETIEAQIEVEADFGLFTLAEDFLWSRTGDVNTFTIGGVTFSLEDDALSGSTDISVNPIALLHLVYTSFAQGNFSTVEENGSYVYTLTLSQDQLDEVIPELVPGTESLDFVDQTGTLQVVITDGAFDTISVISEGSVHLLITDADISLAFAIQFL